MALLLSLEPHINVRLTVLRIVRTVQLTPLRAAIFATVRTYEISHTTRGVYSFDSFFSTVLAILEQNVGIVAANVLPLGPLFSRRQRDMARAESRAAGSTRAARDSLKTPSLLIIQGPGKDSFDEPAGNRPQIVARSESRQHLRGGSGSGVSQQPRSGSRMGSRQSNRRGHHRRESSDVESLGGDWPHGIIKTVEVEVVEEDLADLQRGVQLQLPERGASRASMFSFDQDWANMLRLPDPGSRGPSRQA